VISSRSRQVGLAFRSKPRLRRPRLIGTPQSQPSAFVDPANRKATAEFSADKPNRAVLFRMYDNKPYDTIVWRRLRPDFAKPFKSVEPG
jgi:hypothetical protein